jgi:DNA-binding response OmpR family regulator
MPKKNPQPRMAREELGHSVPLLLAVTGNPAEAELFYEVGRPWDCELTACRDYWEAGWELTRRHYDLALIDIDLYPTLGLEWLSRFLTIAPDLPIIALSGDSSREREIAARNHGIAFYYVKPVEPRELAAICQHVAHKKRQIGPKP